MFGAGIWGSRIGHTAALARARRRRLPGREGTTCGVERGLNFQSRQHRSRVPVYSPLEREGQA